MAAFLPLLIVIVVLIIAFMLMNRYVEPKLNALLPPVGTIAMVVFVILVIIWMLTVGIGMAGGPKLL